MDWVNVLKMEANLDTTVLVDIVWINALKAFLIPDTNVLVDMD